MEERAEFAIILIGDGEQAAVVGIGRVFRKQCSANGKTFLVDLQGCLRVAALKQGPPDIHVRHGEITPVQLISRIGCQESFAERQRPAVIFQRAGGITPQSSSANPKSLYMAARS